jgi:hypothetical protein
MCWSRTITTSRAAKGTTTVYNQKTDDVGVIIGKICVQVLVAAWNRLATSMLPRVLLKSHVICRGHTAVTRDFLGSAATTVLTEAIIVVRASRCHESDVTTL